MDCIFLLSVVLGRRRAPAEKPFAKEIPSVAPLGDYYARKINSSEFLKAIDECEVRTRVVL